MVAILNNSRFSQFFILYFYHKLKIIFIYLVISDTNYEFFFEKNILNLAKRSELKQKHKICHLCEPSVIESSIHLINYCARYLLSFIAYTRTVMNETKSH